MHVCMCNSFKPAQVSWQEGPSGQTYHSQPGGSMQPEGQSPEQY